MSEAQRDRSDYPDELPQPAANEGPAPGRTMLVPQIRTSDNRLRAEIRFVSSSQDDLWPGVGEVEAALRSFGVVEGVNREAIAGMLEGKVPETWFTVAEGVAPEHGTDAVLELLIEVGPSGPREVQDSGGQVDLKDLGLIRNVEKGAVIVRKTPATPGQDGTDVTGAPVRARPGKDLKILPGKNTELSEDGLSLISLVDGHLRQEGNRYHVSPLFEVRGDVDYSTGNLEFYGQLKVYGAVKEDFRLDARGSIEVQGMVEGASLIAGGDLVLKGSVLGMGKGVLDAKGSITAGYLDQCRIRAGKDLVFQKGLMHCFCQVGRCVRSAGEGSGLILGGRIEAGLEVECLTLGNEMGTRTEVSVGVPPDLLDRRKKLERDLLDLGSKKEMVDKNLIYLSRVIRSEGLSQARKEQVEKYAKLRDLIRDQIDKGQKGLEALDGAIDSMKQKSSVRVHGICYPGVAVTIRGNTLLVREAMSEVCFVYEKGAVVAAPLG